MESKEHFENSYRVNYESGRKYIEQKNLPAARIAFRKALQAEVALIKMTLGSEHDRHKERADTLVRWLTKIDELIGAQQKPAVDDPAENTESKKDDSPKPTPPSTKTLQEALADLNELEGLAEVKKAVKELVDIIQNRKERQANNLAVPPMSYHMVFSGNPGTGKTTVARLMAAIYHALGIVSNGHMVEVSRNDMVAGYVGQTAIKTAELCKKAIGGVLFVDEAYTLNRGGNDFGQEAIDTMMKYMEDNRNDLVVIVAGYDELMEKFIASNPGLTSRFTNKIHFADYDGESLYRIFMSMCAKNNYVLDSEAARVIRSALYDKYEHRDSNFGNARDVRTIFEKTTARQASRLNKVSNKSREMLMTIIPEDLAL